jgi:hypothetical protein
MTQLSLEKITRGAGSDLTKVGKYIQKAEMLPQSQKVLKPCHELIFKLMDYLRDKD